MDLPRSTSSDHGMMSHGFVSGFPPPKKPAESAPSGPYRDSVTPTSAPACVPCPFCSLEIDPAALRCPRCQVELEFARCPGCHALGSLGERSCARCGAELPRMVSGEATDAACPRCDGTLRPIEAQDWLDAYHECTKCGGVFLGHHTFANAVRRHAAGNPLPPVLMEHVEPRPDEIVYLRCPCCGAQMHRKRLARMVVDTCKMHGTWFDRGEVARVLSAKAEDPADKAPQRPLRLEARAAVARAQVAAVMETRSIERQTSFVRALLSALFGLPPV